MRKFFLPFISVFVFVFLAAAETKVEQIDPSLLSEALGAKVKTVLKTESLIHIELFKEQSSDSNPDAYLFNTGDLGLSAVGWGGNLDCYVVLSPEGTVISVIVGDNRETPAYLRMVIGSGFLKKWREKKLSDSPPDAVTGATKTSSAINASVAALRSKLEEIKFFE